MWNPSMLQCSEKHPDAIVSVNLYGAILNGTLCGIACGLTKVVHLRKEDAQACD